MPGMHLYVLVATSIIALLLSLNLTGIEAVSFTVTGLSVELDLNSVAIFKGGVISVGKSGIVVLSYMGDEMLKSAVTKPDGAFALVGGVDGGLYILDGYKIHQLPYNAHGGVTDTSLFSDSEALITIAVSVMFKPKTRLVGEGSGSILEDPVTMAVIASSAIPIGTFYVFFRVFKRRIGSPGRGLAGKVVEIGEVLRGTAHHFQCSWSTILSALLLLTERSCLQKSLGDCVK